MRKLTVLVGATLLLLLSGKAATAEEAKKVCHLAQKLAQTNPTALASQTIRGIVRSVVGNVVTLELPDGSLRTVTLTRRERAAMGQILEEDIVVTSVYCNRISLYREPAPPARTLTVPQLSPPRQVPQTLPPRVTTPPPVLPPAIPQAPPRQIIPQTW